MLGMVPPGGWGADRGGWTCRGPPSRCHLRVRVRAARPGIPSPCTNPSRMKRGELESRILILVTLALVAFGLVMVYSATSAAAEVGGQNPNYYLERQGLYAALGIALMVVAQRWNYRRLRLLAPSLVLVSLLLLAAVLVLAPAV